MKQNSMYRKGVVITIIFLFVGISILPATGSILLEKSTVSTLDGNTLYVGGDGPGNYTKIQDAIDDAEDGDTVFVYDDSSPYYENLDVNKSISLIGENGDTTIIDGNGVGDVVCLSADGVTISDFTIQNSGNNYYYYDAGINVTSDYNNIIGNTITNNKWRGVLVYHSSDNNISGNIFTNNHFAIWLSDSSNNTIAGNTAINNEEFIWLNDTTNNNLLDNTITNSYSGIYLLDCTYSTLSGNTLQGNTVGFFIGGHSTNNTIEDNTITGGGMGIQLQSDNNTLSRNTITNHKYGFLSLGCSLTTLRNNNITGNSRAFGVKGHRFSHFLHDIDVSNLVDGRPIYYWINRHNAEVPSNAGYIALVNCTDITIQNMTLTSKYQALLLAYTNNSIIINNNLVDNEIGIELFRSSNNTISGNNLTKGGASINGNHNTFSRNKIISRSQLKVDGISLSGSYNMVIGNEVTSPIGIDLGGSNNTLSCNTIANAEYYGIKLGGADNVIFHNNFINNTRQVESFNWYNTSWDDGYPSGGNYWDDYTGVDNFSGPGQNLSGSDGIGDTPYIIGYNNQDNYPLMSPYFDEEPPNVEITKPEKALYFFNLKVRPYLFRKPLIFGNIDIEVDASDDESGVNWVEFYIDDENKYTDTTEPYSWNWSEWAFFRHTIMVIAYDNAGNNATKEMTVWKFF